MAMKRRFQHEDCYRPQDNESAHHQTQGRTALLSFTFLESITAMALIMRGTVLRLHVKKITVPSQDFFGIHSDKFAIRHHEAANKRLGRKLHVLIGLQQMKKPDPDLGRRRDLFDRDSATLAFLAEEFA
jgi:hypothetical protein